MKQPPGPPHPVFVGGTGRSGTTVLARLIGSHPRYAMIPFEARLQSEPNGIPGLLANRVSVEEFVQQMRASWGWREIDGTKTPKRSRKEIPPERLESVLRAFEASYEQAPIAAASTLVHALLDPIAAAEGKPSWVEMTPYNPAAGDVLVQMFPGMRLIHIVRDGRDVAASTAAARKRARDRGIGTDRDEKTAEELIRIRWERRMRSSHRGTRRMPADRVLVLHFEDLLRNDRDGSYRRLLEFLELDDDQRMRDYFDTKMTPDRAHIGRWREGISEAEAERMNAAYASTLERLRRRGISYLSDAAS